MPAPGHIPVSESCIVELIRFMLLAARASMAITMSGLVLSEMPFIISNVSIPVIASGGAGSKEHFYDALTTGHADAALAASLFHYKELEIMDLKHYLDEKGVSVRI